MKSVLSSLILVLAFSAHGQTVDVNEVDANQEGSTTIEITKGKKSEVKNKNGWEIVEGATPIHGEPAAMEKEARKLWKNACEEWKKEFREDNKENKIVTINCGSPSCSGAVGQKVCSSTSSYKIKTKITNE